MPEPWPWPVPAGSHGRGIGTGVFDTGTGPAYVAWDEWRAGGGTLDMVRAAVLAANAHDTQPWLFRIAPARIDLFADTARNIGTMDPLCREMQISLGCAAENLVLAGPPNGKLPSVLLMPKPSDGTHVAQVDLTPVAASTSSLFEAIPRRHTNRAAYDTGRALAPGALDALSGLIDVPNAGVVWFTNAASKRAFGELTVRATQAIIDDLEMAIDDFAWYRASWDVMQRTKDGITIDASGLPAVVRALGKLLPTSRQQADGAWLSATRDTQVATAAAFGTLVVREPLDPVQRLQAGRVWQRMHLRATADGLAMQPLNQVEERIDRERTAHLLPEFTSALAVMLPIGWHPVMSFRIGYPTTTALRSPRRPAESVVRT